MVYRKYYIDNKFRDRKLCDIPNNLLSPMPNNTGFYNPLIFEEEEVLLYDGKLEVFKIIKHIGTYEYESMPKSEDL